MLASLLVSEAGLPVPYGKKTCCSEATLLRSLLSTAIEILSLFRPKAWNRLLRASVLKVLLPVVLEPWVFFPPVPGDPFIFSC